MDGIGFGDLTANIKKYQQMQKTQTAQGTPNTGQGAKTSSADMNSSIFTTSKSINTSNQTKRLQSASAGVAQYSNSGSSSVDPTTKARRDSIRSASQMWDVQTGVAIQRAKKNKATQGAQGAAGDQSGFSKGISTTNSVLGLADNGVKAFNGIKGLFAKKSNNVKTQNKANETAQNDKANVNNAKDAATAQKAVDQTDKDASKVSTQATQDGQKLNNAQQEQQQAQQVNQQAEANTQNAQAGQAEAEGAHNEAVTGKQTASQNLESAKSDVTSAKSELAQAEAQATDNNPNTANIQAAKRNLEATEQRQTEAERKLEEAKTNEEQAQTNLQQADENVGRAEDQQGIANANLQTAHTQTQSAQAVVSEDQAAITSLSDTQQAGKAKVAELKAKEGESAEGNSSSTRQEVSSDSTGIKPENQSLEFGRSLTDPKAQELKDKLDTAKDNLDKAKDLNDKYGNHPNFGQIYQTQYDNALEAYNEAYTNLTEYIKPQE